MRLADFIAANMEDILQEWEDFAASITPSDGAMTSKELRNHASAMLKSIVEDLRQAQTRKEQKKKSTGSGPRGPEDAPGELHGSMRLESNFSLEQLVAEYRALRASVLRLWREDAGSTPVANLRDVTRFNEAIDHLLAASIMTFAEQSRQAMEEEQRRKDEFLAMLAHELRNPLAPISAAALLLKNARSDESLVHRASDIIARQVTHLTELVDDLLDVSRVTRGLIELKTEPVDVRRVIADAVEQVLPLMRARRHQLTLQEAAETAVVSGDHKRLVQILANLLTNAAKYTPEGGRIVLSTDVHAEQVILAVEDNGIGMPPEVIANVFELFAQAKRTPDRSSGGLGLGLALVKSLVELHHGKVGCSSAGLGKGSRFAVCLPLLVGHGDIVDRRMTERGPTVSGKPLKIMIVDDNADAAQALCIVLECAGHDVIVEHGSKRALEVAQTDVPDVCLLDIGLPELDGNELARRLRAQRETAGILLIALTGYDQDRDRDLAKAAGFDHYMTKPVDTARLLAMLAAVPSV